MDEDNVTVTFPQPIATRDVEAFEIARRQNIATNGRLFCLMLFAACMLLWVFKPGNSFMYLALFSALPVGLAAIADAIPFERMRMAVSSISYSTAFTVFLAALSNIG